MQILTNDINLKSVNHEIEVKFRRHRFNIYSLCSMYKPNMVNISCKAMEKPTKSQKLDIGNTITAKAIPMSRLQRILMLVRQKRKQNKS